MFKSVFVRTLLSSFLDNIIIPLPSSLVNNFAEFSLRFYILHIKLVMFCKVYCAKNIKAEQFSIGLKALKAISLRLIVRKIIF